MKRVKGIVERESENIVLEYLCSKIEHRECVREIYALRRKGQFAISVSVFKRDQIGP